MRILRRLLCFVGFHRVKLVPEHLHPDYIGTCIDCGHQFSLQE